MTATRVPISPALLTWARRRGGHNTETMRRKFKSWDRWLQGGAQPTVKQAEELARFGHVPFGALLLPEPPSARLPIGDFGVGRGGAAEEPSQNLLDVIHQSQRRQDWYRDYADRYGLDRRGFLRGPGHADADKAAATLRSELAFEVVERRGLPDADAARKHLIQQFAFLGGLVVVSSMVGNGTHRILDTEEVRGFTLDDDVAPLVFINAADTKRGQVFSLAHEFPHVFRGDSGVSAEHENLPANVDVEGWCNAVVSEFLIPEADLQQRFDAEAELTLELDRLAGVYLCSTLVVLIRLGRLHLIPENSFSPATRPRLIAHRVGHGRAAQWGRFLPKPAVPSRRDLIARGYQRCPRRPYAYSRFFAAVGLQIGRRDGPLRRNTWPSMTNLLDSNVLMTAGRLWRLLAAVAVDDVSDKRDGGEVDVEQP